MHKRNFRLNKFEYLNSIKRIAEALRSLITLQISLTLALAVGACSTNAQRQGDLIRETGTAAHAENAACNSAVNNNAKYDKIAARDPIRTGAATLAQLSDELLITREEADLLIAWQSEIQPCRDKYIATIRAVVPQIALTREEAGSARDAVFVELIERKISWGTATSKIRDINSQTAREVTSEMQQVTSQLDRQNQAELEQRAIALQNFTNSVNAISAAAAQ